MFSCWNAIGLVFEITRLFLTLFQFETVQCHLYMQFESNGNKCSKEIPTSLLQEYFRKLSPFISFWIFKNVGDPVTNCSEIFMKSNRYIFIVTNQMKWHSSFNIHYPTKYKLSHRLTSFPQQSGPSSQKIYKNTRFTILLF